MKRILLSLALLSGSMAGFAQTIVSTTPENKNVILEEFTGIYCGYCPQGHAIAQSLKTNNPGDVFLVNVHTGGYANPGPGDPDFRTNFGAALASQSGLTGYPAGQVNRHEFPSYAMASGATAMGRNFWTAAANTILSESSYVNVAATANIDLQTRELTVYVEAYYTGSSPVSTKKLNIALNQNNTAGPQSGGNMGSNYNHMHRLIHFLTGQWGDVISTTTQGSLFTQTYTYTIPADHNSIPIELSELEVIAYVAEGNEEIISGNEAVMTLTSSFNNEIELAEIKEIENTCKTEVTPQVTIQNNGMNTLTSLAIEYSINGGAINTHNWTGNLSIGESEVVDLPVINFTPQASNTIDINIPNDDDNTNNSGQINFDEALEGSRNITVDIRTDNYPTEASWEILDSSGTVVASGGNYTGPQNGGGPNAMTTISTTHVLPASECYTIKLKDSYGDGWSYTNSIQPGIAIKSQGNIIYNKDVGNFGSELVLEGAFKTNTTLGVADNDTSVISVYPNPAQDAIFVNTLDNFNIEIFDITGKLVHSAKEVTKEQAIGIGHLENGVYFVNLASKTVTYTTKLIKK